MTGQHSFCCQLCLLSLATAAISALQFDECRLSHRLPGVAVPYHYEVSLKMNTITSRTSGAVDINVHLPGPGEQAEVPRQKPVNWLAKVANSQANRNPYNRNYRLVLHADSTLEILDFKYYDLGKSDKNKAKRSFKGTSMCHDPITRMIELRFNHYLKPGTRGKLHIEFAGKLPRGRAGHQRGQVKYSLPNDARLLFPSFDEPDLRATFAVRLFHEADILSISRESVPTDEKKDALGSYRLVKVNALHSKTSPNQMASELHHMKFLTQPPSGIYKS